MIFLSFTPASVAYGFHCELTEIDIQATMKAELDLDVLNGSLAHAPRSWPTAL